MPCKRTGARRFAKAKVIPAFAIPKPSETLNMSKLSKRVISAAFQKQEGQRIEANQKAKINQAMKKFRPKKSERGTLVFIGFDGKRVKGNRRKGYVIKVGRKGGKRFVEAGHGFRPSTYRAVKIKQTLSTSKESRDFYRARLVKTKSGKAVVKGRGSVQAGGQWDFSDKVVSEIAGSIQRVLQGHKSQRVFLIEAIVSVRKEDGTLKAVEVSVPISKADHINIELGGIFNFVRLQFYAYLAKQLAFDGYVTSGSANHVRRLKENKRKKRDKWTKKGQLWEGHDYEDVTIEAIEWQIQQLK